MPLLLQAAGAGWRLEIIGKLPELPPFLATTPESSILVTGVSSMERHDAKSNSLVPIAPGDLMEPLFFEAVAYDIHFEKLDPSATLKLPPGAEARRVRPDTEHHLLNFGNNVGFSDLLISSSGGNSRIRIEAFSRKADYRTDYVAMRDDVSAMLRNLAMAANAKTYGLAAPAKDHYPTLVEWFALLKSHFDDFIKLALGIAKNPHSALAKKAIAVDTERARRVSRQAIARALRSENGGAAISSLGIALPRKIHESVSTPTFDTPENRYFKGLIKATYRNIRALSHVKESGDEDADLQSERKFFDSIRPTLQGMERQLEAVLRAPFLGQVADAALVLLCHKN
ncbi:DUF2357 domain-containing protein [Ramlibacter sp. 2FC]|uniref:DUF2357 domain-containing protein n=1 Tax=Ramlibacter sp. 2FC TaxID=2502188 RepID=UPI0010F991AC|nr:DUF2357 domain-containing protein [Ramlibacter sp. 2FC]